MGVARNGKIEHLIDFLPVENGVKNLSLKSVYALLCASLLSALMGIRPAYALLSPTILVDAELNPFPPYYYIVDQTVLLTVKVENSTGALPAPTGTVTFLDGGTPIPGCVSKTIVYYAADLASEQSCFTADLPAGTDTITVQYSGDTNYASTGTMYDGQETMYQASTTTALVSSGSPSSVGQLVTFTSTVSPQYTGPITPTSTVTFFDNGTAISICANLALDSSLQAACSISTLTERKHDITATYNGDTNFETSTSSPVAQMVGPQSGPSFIVTTNDDHDDGECGLTDCTLREAINAANAYGSATTITFTSTLSGETIALGSNLPTITGDTTIDGSSLASQITVNGENSYRPFEIDGNVTLDNLIIYQAHADSASGGYGGGILNYGNLTVIDSTFSNGFGFDALGFGSGGGGGIYNAGSATVANSTFVGNAGLSGGGIFNDGSLGGNLTVLNSTFYDNTALTGKGDGIYNFNSGNLNLANTIIANSSHGADCTNELGTIGTDKNNLIQSSANACGLTNGTNGDIIGSDPKLSGSLQNNGGGALTLALLNGSPAIDAGDDTTCSSSPVNGKDERGVTRPQGTHCDIGAYELISPPSVTVNQATTQSDPTNTGPIHFTAIFSEAIDTSTFSSSSVTLGGTAGGTLSVVIAQDPPNDGTTFDIAVSGMTSTGTVTASIPVNAVTTNSGASNTASTSIDNSVTYDITAPMVSSTSLKSSYTSPGPSSFTTTFSEDVYNPTNNTDPKAVSNPANYLLVERGANQIFDTQSCQGGVAGDDKQVVVSNVTYDSNTRTATVTLATALPAGHYRLFVCGTTSITDLAGNTLNSGSDYTFDLVVRTAGGNDTGNRTGNRSNANFVASALPSTGFPQGQVTSLPKQPLSKQYASTDLTLDIPALKVNTAIVGVPQSGDGWDVTWLGNNAGWLNGTAFPTWSGNSVITGHVWNADNTPGIFVNLKQLHYGADILIHAFGQTYTYEVRENRLVWPDQSEIVLQHEDQPYLTLLTCEDYNMLFTTYSFRRMVRAVLISVK